MNRITRRTFMGSLGAAATMPALPVPIAAALREVPSAKPSPKLGADNGLLG